MSAIYWRRWTRLRELRVSRTRRSAAVRNKTEAGTPSPQQKNVTVRSEANGNKYKNSVRDEVGSKREIVG